MEHPTAETLVAAVQANDYSFRGLSLSAILERFAEGDGVPGSGSANALAAAIAACLAAAVAVKTRRTTDTKYVHVQQTALEVERRARKVREQLVDLFEEDSAVFAPVIALRRDTGRDSDVIRQDDSLRKEVAALKPATDLPLRIAHLAIEVGRMALAMLDSGFAAARGESYTALAQAISAIDGAVFVAQVNIRTVRRRIARLNDPQLEADWIQRVLRDVAAIRDQWQELRVREHLARTALDRETFAAVDNR